MKENAHSLLLFVVDPLAFVVVLAMSPPHARGTSSHDPMQQNDETQTQHAVAPNIGPISTVGTTGQLPRRAGDSAAPPAAASQDAQAAPDASPGPTSAGSSAPEGAHSAEATADAATAAYALRQLGHQPMLPDLQASTASSDAVSPRRIANKYGTIKKYDIATASKNRCS